MSSRPSLKRASLSYFFGTIVSRLTGLVRDVALSTTFGTDPLLAPFLIAFRCANILRRLLGEGAMQATFIPLYEQTRAKESVEGDQLFRNLITTVSGSLITLSLFLMLLSPAIPSTSFLAHLLRMQNATVFICTAAITGAYLQCQGYYFLSAIAPAIFNLTWAITAITVRSMEKTTALTWMSWSMVLGYALQWLVQWWWARATFRQRASSRGTLFAANLRPLAMPLTLGIVGVGATQINTLLDLVFGQCASKEGVAQLWFSLRIYQFPLALIAIALSNASLPSLAHFINQKNHAEARRVFRTAAFYLNELLLPAQLGLLLTGPWIINALFGYNSFHALSVVTTTWALWGYALGLWPQGHILILSNALYSLGLYRITTFCALVAFCVNITLNTIFIFWLQAPAASVALATSLSTWTNYTLLRYFHAQHCPYLHEKCTQTENRGCLQINLLASLCVLLAQALLSNLPVWRWLWSDTHTLATAIENGTLYGKWFELLTYVALYGLLWLFKRGRLLLQ